MEYEMDTQRMGYGNNSLEHSFLNDFNDILRDGNSVLESDFYFNLFEKEVHKVMIDSLLKAKARIKELLGYDVFLFISIVDSERTKSVENQSAKKLNSTDRYCDFYNR